MSWIVEDALKQRNIERVRKLYELVGYDYGVKKRGDVNSFLERTPTEQLRSMIANDLGYKSDLKVMAKLEEKYEMEILVGGFNSDHVSLKPRKHVMLQNILPIVDYLYGLKDAGYLLTFDAFTNKRKAADQVVGEEDKYEDFFNGWYIDIVRPNRRSIVSIHTEFSHLENGEYVKEICSTIYVNDSRMEDPKTKEILNNIAVHVLGLKNPYDSKIEQ